MNIDLIRKYNVPGPRYTSYPTVPFWSIDPEQQQWKESVFQTFKRSNSKDGISLYIHLPYCESLCTYCGCNTRITINHKVEEPYIETLLKEWSMYLALFDEKPCIREIHLGGGTPTFFSPENLRHLISCILDPCSVHPDHEFSFEAHPKNTSNAHLQTLFDLGFRRLSLGIQDFDPTVQEVINRIQPFAVVANVVENARRIGYESINFDLIYGLPLQKQSSIIDTIEKSCLLKPDRIAFYSYAHVPWIKPGQRRYTERDLPSGPEKRALYETGKQMFEEEGYVEIGMDHFALPTDGLYRAMVENKMHRNFMGYTSGHTELMIGLGASSISDSWECFTQNIKKVEDYTKAVESGVFPFYRGHMLSEEDLQIRLQVLNAMCQMSFDLKASGLDDPKSFSILNEFMQDGLIEISGDQVNIKERGRPFVRNICMSFDKYLLEKEPQKNLFSQTV